MTKKRRYAAAASIGNRVYIVGGYDTKTRLRSVERLDLSKEKPIWENVAPMCFRRALPAVCAVDGSSLMQPLGVSKQYFKFLLSLQGKIFVVGGFDGQTRHYSMEFYNEETDSWSLLEGTSVSREGAGLVAFNNALYCIGMTNGLLLGLPKWSLTIQTVRPFKKMNFYEFEKKTRKMHVFIEKVNFGLSHTF
jgi:hypothetical protein